jgi:hypothetical protein
MLTVADIRDTVNRFPEDKPVEELLDELVLMYKVQKGLKDAEEGKVVSPAELEKELELWWKSK